MGQYEDNFSQVSALQLPSTQLGAKALAKRHTFQTVYLDNAVPVENIQILITATLMFQPKLKTNLIKNLDLCSDGRNTTPNHYKLLWFSIGISN